MHNDIINALDAMAAVSEMCGYDRHAKRARELIQRLKTSSAQNAVMRKELVGFVSGMGSFTDLGLRPPEGSSHSPESLQKLQWELADSLCNAVNSSFE